MDQQQKLFWPVSKLQNWDRNPRTTNKNDFARLKNQIVKLGQYKPLIITKDGTVLGGNMRLMAYRALGIMDAWVSVVEAKTPQEMVEYALSDNDRIGNYDEELLAELLMEVPDIQLGDYKVDLGKLTDLKDVLAKYGPDDESPVVKEEPELCARCGQPLPKEKRAKTDSHT